MGDEAYKIHCELMTKIVTEWLYNGSDALETFQMKVKTYLKTPKQKSLTKANDILEELRRKGLHNEHRFDVLLEVTDGIDADLTSLIKEYQNRIIQVTNTSNDSSPGLENAAVKNTKRKADNNDSVVKKERVRESDNGAEFRKGQDTSLKTKEMHQFCDKKTAYSVGYIQASGEGGTGFAVGNKYVMTAYHVLRTIIEKIWNATVGRSQEAHSRNENWKRLPSELKVEMDTNKSPEDGIKEALEKWRAQNPHRLNMSEVFGALYKIGFSDAAGDLIQFLQLELQKKTCIHFGPDKSEEFRFKYDIPYMNPELDVIVLEIDTTNQKQPIPKCLKLQRDCQQLKPEMHLIGYPRMQGSEQILDPRCVVICTDESREKAEIDMHNAIAWFNRTFPNDSVNFDQEYNNIASLLLNKDNFVYFHSSESTAHGASGGPGIVEWDSDRPVVQAMLVSGCPSFTYSAKSNGAYYKGVKIPFEYLFEKGLLMAELHEQLSNEDENLRNELFYNVK